MQSIPLVLVFAVAVSRILRSEMEEEGISPNKIFVGGFSQVTLLLTSPR
jgi:predicted esterase